RVKANPVMTEAGIAPALIKSNVCGGDIVLTATAKGLSAGRAIIKSFPHNGLLVPGNAHGKRHDFSNHTRLFHESITVGDNHIVDPKHEHSDSYFEHCYFDGESLLSIDLGVSYNLIGAQIKSDTFPGIYKIEVKNRCED